MRACRAPRTRRASSEACAASAVESWATGYLNGNVSDLVVFGILIGFMLIKPTGLLGTPALQKV